MGSDELLCYIIICKVGSFKKPVAAITSLPEIYFRFRRFILLVQMKKIDFYAAAQAAENHGDQQGFT